MDSVFPLLESAFSKAFGNLTILQKASCSKTGTNSGATSNRAELTSGWTIAIASWSLIWGESGAAGTILTSYGPIIGNYDARVLIYSGALEAYARAPAYGASISIVTFTES